MSISDDGVEFRPHLDACFLAVIDGEQLAFTNAVNSSWRPTTPDPIAITAVITMLDHPDGTDYRVVVKHSDPTSRAPRRAPLSQRDGRRHRTTGGPLGKRRRRPMKLAAESRDKKPRPGGTSRAATR